DDLVDHHHRAANENGDFQNVLLKRDGGHEDLVSDKPAVKSLLRMITDASGGYKKGRPSRPFRPILLSLRLYSCDCCFFFTGIFDEGQPVVSEGCRTFGEDDVEKLLLQTLRNLAASSATDRDAIDRSNRCDLSSRACEKEFVGEIKCRALDLRFDDLDT